MLVRMTWRNLWRRKRRTLITAFTVAGGVFLSVFFTGSGDYVYTNMIDTSATMGFGHVTVEGKGYNASPSLKTSVSGTKGLRDRILAIPGVTDAAVRISGQAMFASAAKNIGGVFMAVDPDQESSKNNVFVGSIVEGEMFDDTKGRGIVVGARMAEKLNLKLGRKVVYTTTDINGEIVSEIARVTGLFRTGVNEVDGFIALLPIDAVRTLIRYGQDEGTLISVFMEDQRYSARMRARILSAVGDDSLEIMTWDQTQPDVAGYVAMDRSMNHLSQVLVGLLIAAGILNTMFMSVLERRREFGIMMAIGMSPSRLFVMVLVESFWLGLLGLAMGVALTSPCFYYVYNTGLDLTAFMEDGADIGGVLLDPVMKIRLYWESSIAIIAGVFTLTMLAGLYPAYRAGRIAPVESIKTI